MNFEPKKISIITATILSCATYAQEIKVNTKLTQTNVFISGAQLFHQANVNLPAGTSEIHLEGISPSIQAGSIQAGGKGDFIIMDVGHFVYFPEPETKPENSASNAKTKREIKSLEDSLSHLQFELDMLTDRRNVLQSEKRIIDGNKLYKGEGKSDSLALFTAAMEFYRKKMNEINAELIKIKRDEQKLVQKRDLQTQRLDELRNFLNQHPSDKPIIPLHKIRMVVMAEQPVQAMLLVNYFITEAGWTPQYDIRAVNTDSPVKLHYKAMLHQNSGLDWNNVKLSLSTSNPRQSNHKPVLIPQYLSFQQLIRTQSVDYMNRPAVAKAEDRNTKAKEELDYDAVFSDQFTELKENISNFQYDIKLPYKIPSDGKSHAISILQKEVSSSFDYVVVPKLDNDAFITASVSGWEDLNLISGKANIYFENMYVGETFINSQQTGDTLSIVLGREQSIQVSKKRIKSNEKERFINNEKVLTYQYEITVKNNKNTNLRLKVEDNIPVSNHQQIKVELMENGKAQVEPNTGMMLWDLKLKPKEQKVLKYTYVIRHDRDKLLSNLP